MKKGKKTIKKHNKKNNNRRLIKQTEKKRQIMKGGATVNEILEIRLLQQQAKNVVETGFNKCSNQIKTIKFNRDRTIVCPDNYSDRKTKPLYHPDSNKGCKELSTKVFQMLDATCKNAEEKKPIAEGENKYTTITAEANKVINQTIKFELLNFIK